MDAVAVTAVTVAVIAAAAADPLLLQTFRVAPKKGGPEFFYIAVFFTCIIADINII